MPLITLVSQHRGLGPAIVAYLNDLARDSQARRLVVLIPEVQPEHIWQALLFNQRGAVLDRAIRQGTTDVVIAPVPAGRADRRRGQRGQRGRNP